MIHRLSASKLIAELPSGESFLRYGARPAIHVRTAGRGTNKTGVAPECRYRSTGELTAIRSMTRKADEARIRQEMAAAIAAYTGPVTKCPPGKARGGPGKVKLLIRPRYTPPKGTTQASNPQIHDALAPIAPRKARTADTMGLPGVKDRANGTSACWRRSSRPASLRRSSMGPRLRISRSPASPRPCRVHGRRKPVSATHRRWTA